MLYGSCADPSHAWMQACSLHEPRNSTPPDSRPPSTSTQAMSGIKPAVLRSTLLPLPNSPKLEARQANHVLQTCQQPPCLALLSCWCTPVCCCCLCSPLAACAGWAGAQHQTCRCLAQSSQREAEQARHLSHGFERGPHTAWLQVLQAKVLNAREARQSHPGRCTCAGAHMPCACTASLSWRAGCSTAASRCGCVAECCCFLGCHSHHPLTLLIYAHWG